MTPREALLSAGSLLGSQSKMATPSWLVIARAIAPPAIAMVAIFLAFMGLNGLMTIPGIGRPAWSMTLILTV